MDQKLNGLLQSLADVTEVFTYLSERLQASAQELRISGKPPERSLINEVMAARQNFAELRTQVCTLAATHTVSPLPEVESVATLNDLKVLLERIAVEEERKAAERVAQRAIMILERIGTLRHSSVPGFVPLAECQTQAIALRDEIAATPPPQIHPQAEAIARENEGFSALLTLVGQKDDLDDELCGAFQEVINQAFGKSLAIAALRGKIVFADAGLSTHKGAETLDVPSRAEPVSIVPERAADAESGVSWSAEAKGSVPERSLVGEAGENREIAPGGEIAPARFFFAPSTSNGPGGEEKHESMVEKMGAPDPAPSSGVETPREATTNPSLYHFALTDRSQKMAALLLGKTNGSTSEKPSILRDLTWRLIFEERMSLAYHVARSLETHYPEAHPRLPSWVLRAAVLGQRLRTPRGEIARVLKEDFAQHQGRSWETGNPEWDTAAELLLVAAALSPALLAPETGAAALLRSLRLPEHLSHLSQLCDRIAAYSEQLVPLDPLSFKKPTSRQFPEIITFLRGGQGKKDAHQEQLDMLRQDVLQYANPVIAELRELCDSSASVLVLGGVGCCQRMIEQVRAFLDEETPFQTDEPLPRPLLNADLSRIPSLVMNKQGEIEGMSHPAFADSILRLVASGSAKVL